MKKYDVIIIGSGINSLIAGAILAKRSKKVLILEKNDWLGGCIKTSEITLPKFIHDELAASHPTFVASPAYKELKSDLEKHGLTYKNTNIPTGVVLPDGTSTIMYNNRNKNVELFNQLCEGDGHRYNQVMKNFEKNRDFIQTVLSNEVQSKIVYKKVFATIRKKGWQQFIYETGLFLKQARDFLENNFKGKEIKALFVPWVLHAGLGPDDSASSIMLQVMMDSLEQTSIPIPKGGGINLVNALRHIIEEHGGELWTNYPVSEIIVEKQVVQGVIAKEEKMFSSYVLANVTPKQLYNNLLRNEPIQKEIIEAANQFTFKTAGMQIHYALREQLDWQDEALQQAAVIHLTSGIEAVSRSVNEAMNGYIPAEPTIAIGQHSVLDPSRAPDNHHTLWIQLLELPSKLKGDALHKIKVKKGYTTHVIDEIVRRVEKRIASSANNFYRSMLHRTVITPNDLERLNPNLVDGNPYAGDGRLDQLLLFRPSGLNKNHETIIKNLYQIGASTHPGPGLSGMSGYLVAKTIK